MASVETLSREAEFIGDGLLEAALGLRFAPTVQGCDALVATSNGAIAYARTLKIELLKAKSLEAA
jgi:hypothetical protein